MTFTYDLEAEDDDELNISKVRLELGDVVEGAGVRPDGSNLSDEEIAVWLEQESGDIMHTVIRGCNAMARAWSTIASIAVGPRREDLGKVAENWQKNAKELIDQYGAPIGSGSAFAVATNRSDGYSENAATTTDL